MTSKIGLMTRKIGSLSVNIWPKPCVFLTVAAEKILRRKLNPKYEAYLNGAFMILLLAFMVLITFKDIFQLFT